MKMIFDRNGEGRQELVAALGMISDSLDYSKWKPVLPLAARQLTCIIGADVFSEIVDLYRTDDLDPEKEELVFMAQRAVAYFAWVKVVPTLDAQHGGSGRQKKLGENEKGLTALQEYKDEMNILNLAYESVDALVGFLEEKQFDFWEKAGLKDRWTDCSSVPRMSLTSSIISAATVCFSYWFPSCVKYSVRTFCLLSGRSGMTGSSGEIQTYVTLSWRNASDPWRCWPSRKRLNAYP